MFSSLDGLQAKTFLFCTNESLKKFTRALAHIYNCGVHIYNMYNLLQVKCIFRNYVWSFSKEGWNKGKWTWL